MIVISLMAMWNSLANPSSPPHYPFTHQQQGEAAESNVVFARTFPRLKMARFLRHIETLLGFLQQYCHVEYKNTVN